MKNLIIVISLSILIGVGIFLVDHQLDRTGDLKLPQTIRGLSNIAISQPSPTSTPKPTPPPISPASNLEEEINKLTPPDFSADFNQLREALNN